jgi:hypothetical protein
MYVKSAVGNFFHAGPYFGQTACRRALQEISAVRKLLTISVTRTGLTHRAPKYPRSVSRRAASAGNKKKVGPIIMFRPTRDKKFHFMAKSGPLTISFTFASAVFSLHGTPGLN